MNLEQRLFALTEMVVDAGLLLGGDYAQADGSRRPYSLRLDLLGSYPRLLDAVASVIAPLVGSGTYSRLLCPLDAVPLGTAVALRTGLPLVYSRGTHESPVADLVGAYDIGHKTLLLLNDNALDDSIATLVRRARGVGLDVDGMIALVDVRGAGGGADIACSTLLRVEELLRVASLRHR